MVISGKMTIFVLSYEIISSSYQGTKTHNFCVFEIEFVRQLFPDYKPIDLNIWHTFTDTKLEKILQME